MAEAETTPQPRGAESAAPKPPHVGALFKEGRHSYEHKAYGWEGLATFRSILIDPDPEILPRDRKVNEHNVFQWCFENILAYSKIHKLKESAAWASYITDWERDLEDAATRTELNESPENVRVLKSYENKIRDMIAVSVAARAMEFSNGTNERFAGFITEGAGLEIDGDTSGKNVLYGHPERLNRVIDEPLVRYFYDKVLMDAGVTVVNEWYQEEVDGKIKNRPSQIRVDNVETARSGTLVKYIGKKAANGGMDGYVDALMEEAAEIGFTFDRKEVSKGTVRSAIRLACDAFLVDKYTRWEFIIDKDNKLDLNPVSKNWDWKGDPFRSILEPSFLPRRIKGRYAGEFAPILDLMDISFSPTDVFSEETSVQDEIVQPSACENLSKQFRLQEAIWLFLGGSMAPNIPVWSEDVLGKDLPKIAANLIQVYGGLKDGDFPVGKHLVGVMLARLLQTKALSTSTETEAPNRRDYIKRIFGESAQVARPFYKVLQHLWGEEVDATSGWLKSLRSGAGDVVFRGNKFDADRYLREAFQLLDANDMDPQTQKMMRRADLARFAIRSITAIQEVFLKGR